MEENGSGGQDAHAIQMTRDIGSDVAALLRERITGYDLLEILMFLHAHRGEPWSRARLAERVYVPLDHIAEALEGLIHQGLVIREAGGTTPVYRYAASEPRIHAAVEELARLFVEQRAAIMSIMSSNAIERVRSKAPAAFADAFILRKKNDDG